MVTVTLYATLRDMAGSQRIRGPFQPGGTRPDFIPAMASAYPPPPTPPGKGDGELSGEVHVFVQGRNVVWLDGIDTVINPGDEIDLIPPVAGG